MLNQSLSSAFSLSVDESEVSPRQKPSHKCDVMSMTRIQLCGEPRPCRLYITGEKLALDEKTFGLPA